MPIVQIHLLEGRSKELKQQLISEITAAVSRTLGNSPESIRVLLHDIPHENWGAAGLQMSNRREN